MSAIEEKAPLAQRPEWYVSPDPRYALTNSQIVKLQAAALIDKAQDFNGAISAKVREVLGMRTPPVDPVRSAVYTRTGAAAEENYTGWWDAHVGLKQLNNPDHAEDFERLYFETFGFVGCHHGGSDAFYARLDRFVENPPDVLILSGDKSGPPNGEVDTLKAWLYNGFVNRAKPLLDGTSEISDSDLLNASGGQAPLDSPTVRHAIKNILTFQGELKHGDRARARSEVDALSDSELADYARAHCIPNTGHFLRTWDYDARFGLMARYAEAEKKLEEKIDAMRVRKPWMRVIAVEGNEDSLQSINEWASDLPNLFDTQAALEPHGIEVVRNLDVIETDTAAFVCLPFFDARDYENVSRDTIEALQLRVKDAREAGKSVILVGHSEFRWDVHRPGEVPQGEKAKIIRNAKQVLADFQPDEFEHAHQHDEMPKAPHRDAKYFVQGNDEQVYVGSYLPRFALGELRLPRFASDPEDNKVIFAGGKRRPIHRII